MAINKLLQVFGDRMPPVNYSFDVWKDAPVYPYWVSTVGENARVFEDGSIAGTITLRGWTRGSWNDFIAEAETIKKRFAGYTYSESGFGCAIDANTSNIIPQTDIELKSMEIVFDYKTWEV